MVEGFFGWSGCCPTGLRWAGLSGVRWFRTLNKDGTWRAIHAELHRAVRAADGCQRSQGVPRLWHDVARATRQEACATDLLGCSLLLQAALKGASGHTGRVRHTCCTARAE